MPIDRQFPLFLWLIVDGIDMAMSSWLRALISDVPPSCGKACVISGTASNDPLPELSVRGRIVFYAGNLIYEAASPEAAVAYRDRQINFYI